MIYAYIFVMAGVTYLIRMLPLTLVQKKMCIRDSFRRNQRGFKGCHNSDYGDYSQRIRENAA